MLARIATVSRRALLIGAALLIALSVSGSINPLHAQDDNAGQRKQTEQKLSALREQIHALARQARKTAGQRDNLHDKLAQQATTLDSAARALKQTDAAIADKQQALQKLADERATLKQHLDTQREALAQLLRAAYALGQGSDMRVLLGDENLPRIARALAYSRYFQGDRLKRIRALGQDLSRLQAVETSLAEQRRALETTRQQQAAQAQDLERARAEQQTLLAKTEQELKTQQQKLAELKRDEQALDTLLRQLRDVFADIPKALPAERPFAKQRGALPWPLHGHSHAKGHGLMITATPGTQVHAVAHGRVAYADWLRGYGMLVIIDHGDGYMSLYGNNESLQSEVGDWVDAGTAIATSGNGRDGRGLYFELRHDGHPLSAQPWLAH